MIDPILEKNEKTQSMKTNFMTCICGALFAMAIGISSGWAAKEKKSAQTAPAQLEKPDKVKKEKKRKKQAAPRVELNAAGQKLLERYSEQLKALQAEVSKALPTADEQKKAAYLEACEAEDAVEARLNAAQAAMKKNNSAAGLLRHRIAWMGRAEAGVAAAQEKLKEAEAMTGDEQAKAEALKSAREEMAEIQENHRMATSELKESQDAVVKAEPEKPALTKATEAAREELAQARAKTLEALKDLNLDSLLSSDQLDTKLAKYVVLLEATPHGLAEFAQQGAEQEKLIEQLLGDPRLMIQMLVADGAEGGKYGQAMKIYTDIQKASAKAKEGNLQRLALAVGLEHAVPVAQSNPKAQTDGPANVDPVQRYMNYEKAFLDGELDPAFKDLSVWEYRYVVNGDEAVEAMAWGREMLRNYRPDLVSMPDYCWRYVKSVATEVKYGSQDLKAGKDRPELHKYQNVIMNGGVCGRRAFFGRFILRSFGIPTTARPQTGHAALVHWTPNGWVVCLGGGWGVGTTGGNYKKDLDFLATTQGRKNESAFLQVKRAQWAGDVLGEKRTYGFLSGDPAFWNGVSLHRQRAIIDESKAQALAAVGEDIGEANESKEEEVLEKVPLSEEDRKIVVGTDGSITIPAAACSKPTNNTAKIRFMPSNLGGMQLHYGRLGDDQDFEYTFEAPSAGIYALSARVVTTSDEQHLFVAANGGEPTDIAVPFTVGMWDNTQPVEVSLAKGRNVLRFSRPGATKGLTIRDFTLNPVK
jgi:hypothetical protein